MIETMLTCDKCRHWISYEAPKTAVLEIARRRGWSVGKKGHFCPSCRPRPKTQRKEAQP